MPSLRILFLAMAVAAGVPGVAAAQAWQAEWNLRLRHEHVADDAFAATADVTTARLRAGLHGRFGTGWEALLEAEAIAAGGNQVSRPAVTDPEGAEINQAWLRNAAGPVVVTVGRQRLLGGDQRWLGNSGWRQNEQTFDAVALDWRHGPGMTARYWWLGRVHRVNGGERELDSHYLELEWKGGDGALAPYALLHRDRDAATASTATAGVRASWEHLGGDGGADRGGARLGTELDASLAFLLARGLRGLLKIADYRADYRADGHARDTRKGWLQLEWTP